MQAAVAIYCDCSNDLITYVCRIYKDRSLVYDFKWI